MSGELSWCASEVAYRSPVDVELKGTSVNRVLYKVPRQNVLEDCISPPGMYDMQFLSLEEAP